MDYLVVMYDEHGVKCYNFRQSSPMKALLNLAELANAENDTYPFKNAACFLNDKSVWRVTID